MSRPPEELGLVDAVFNFIGFIESEIQEDTPFGQGAQFAFWIAMDYTRISDAYTRYQKMIERQHNEQP